MEDAIWKIAAILFSSMLFLWVNTKSKELVLDARERFRMRAEERKLEKMGQISGASVDEESY